MGKAGRKASRKTLVKKLDKIVSQYIRLRDKYCVVCGSGERLTNGHLYSRTTYSTRWDITDDGNCHCQCWGCNFKHEFDPYPYTNWYIEKFGKDKWDELHTKFRTLTKYSNTDLEELYETIKKKYEELDKQV